ncbi:MULTISPECIES: sensor histidine kinase [Pseudomonas]|nr:MULTISPECIES: sensor histidine kinase [Pseudomonas]ANI35937.1 ATP-binding protein [Pseudomonas sp. JY-Q]
MKIDFPKQLDKDCLGGFFAQLAEAKDHPERVTINFGSLEFSTPTSMLVVGVVLRNWVTYRKSRGLEVWRSELNDANGAQTYLMHLGFFDFIGVQQGKKVGEAQGSQTYLPIIAIEKPADAAQAGELAAWYDSIQTVSRKLAGVLAGSHDDSNELRLYTYAIREIIRNVFEHSGATECFVCGQRWSNGVAELVVVDEGIGISRSLRAAYEIADDQEALKQAIRPGVSRTANLTAEQNIYDNSGFGLFVLSEIGSHFGWFLLGSGQSKLLGEKKDFSTSVSSFDGTYVGLRVNKTPSDMAGLLQDIIRAGEEEAALQGIAQKASAMSKLG